MNEHLLTFEIDKDSDQLFIHGDPTGLKYLSNVLVGLIAEQAKNDDFPHSHLFSEEWGGNELSSNVQEKNGRLINHVKIYCWPTKEGARPYKNTRKL